MTAKKRKGCPNISINRSNCPCPEDCPRRGLCCECIEFHAALGQVPYCVKKQVEAGAECSAGKTAKSKQPAELMRLDTPGFRLTDYASCAG